MRLRQLRPLTVPLGLIWLLVSVVRVAPADAKSPPAAIVLQGATGNPVRLTLGELKNCPRVEIEAADRGGKKAKYAGVPLRALLDRIGVPQGENLRGEWLGAFVLVDAKDGYRAVFSLAELDPGFSDRTIFLADSRNGRPLDKGRGPFQVIVPGEKRHARWVRLVTEIRVVDSRAVK